VCNVKDMSVLTLKFDYTYLAKIQNISAGEKFEIRDVSYEDKVTVKIAAEPENVSCIKSRISDISAGTYQVISETAELVKCF